MKEKIQIIIFALFLIAIASVFRYFSGPFYFGNNLDPSYLYLYNFLYILEGKNIQFVDHPGTSLDMLGASLVKIFYTPSQHIPLLLAVIPKAEQILTLVWFLMIVFYAVTFAITGFYAFKKSQDWIFTQLVLLSSLWLMAIPSINKTGVMPICAHVNSDTMMMAADNLMILSILRFYFSPDKNINSQAISLGSAVAFALCTKITSLPFIVLGGVLLFNWQARISFLIVTASCFILLTWPIWKVYPHLISWVEGLILKRGMHGSGGAGFDAVIFFHNFVEIIKCYWFFVACWITAGVVAVRTKLQLDPKIRRILLGLAVSGLVQVIIVAKQMSFHYMAPMIGLSSLVLAFLYRGFTHWQRRLKFASMAVLMISLGLISLNIWQVNNETQKTKQILDTIKKSYSQYYVCPYYRSSIPGFGFVFWNNMLSRDDYGTILKEYYPQMVYFDIFSNEFKDSAGQKIPFSQLRKQKELILLYGSDLDPKSFEPNLTVKRIYSNGGPEALYEVTSARSDLDLEYSKLATISRIKEGQPIETYKGFSISYFDGYYFVFPRNSTQVKDSKPSYAARNLWEIRAWVDPSLKLQQDFWGVIPLKLNGAALPSGKTYNFKIHCWGIPIGNLLWQADEQYIGHDEYTFSIFTLKPGVSFTNHDGYVYKTILAQDFLPFQSQEGSLSQFKNNLAGVVTYNHAQCFMRRKGLKEDILSDTKDVAGLLTWMLNQNYQKGSTFQSTFHQRKNLYFCEITPTKFMGNKILINIRISIIAKDLSKKLCLLLQAQLIRGTINLPSQLMLHLGFLDIPINFTLK